MMEFNRYNQRTGLFLLFTILLNCGFTYAEDPKEVFDKAKDAMNYAGEAYAALAMIQNVTSMLGSTGKLLAILGPSFGIAGNIFGLISVFIDTKDPTLAKIEQLFSQLNARIDIVNYKLDFLAVLTKYENAKQAYRKDMTTIIVAKNKLNAYMKARGNVRKVHLAEFNRMYAQNFPLTFDRLFLGIVELRPRTVAADLVTIFSQYHKCNAVKVAQLCTELSAIFTGSMQIEAAYHGLKKRTKFVQEQAKKWSGRMKKFGDQCQNVIDDCINGGWKAYYHSTADYYFKESVRSSGDMNRIARDVRTALDENFPQQMFTVIVHKDVYGFDSHMTAGNALNLWHNSYTDKALTTGNIPKSIISPPSTLTRASLKRYIESAKSVERRVLFSTTTIANAARSTLLSIVESNNKCGKCSAVEDYYRRLYQGMQSSLNRHFFLYALVYRIPMGYSSTNNVAYYGRFGEQEGIFCCVRDQSNRSRLGPTTRRGAKCAKTCKTLLIFNVDVYRGGDHDLKTAVLYMGRN